jgi:hypothetical protein
MAAEGPRDIQQQWLLIDRNHSNQQHHLGPYSLGGIYMSQSEENSYPSAYQYRHVQLMPNRLMLEIL